MKTIETRTWKPAAARIGSRIAIHAAKTDNPDTRAAEDRARQRGLLPIHIDRGCVIATAKLEFVFRVVGTDGVPVPEMVIGPDQGMQRLRDRVAAEIEWGDYSKGRLCWGLGDVEQIEDPVLCIGRQGLFKVAL